MNTTIQFSVRIFQSDVTGTVWVPKHDFFSDNPIETEPCVYVVFGADGRQVSVRSDATDARISAGGKERVDGCDLAAQMGWGTDEQWTTALAEAEDRAKTFADAVAKATRTH